MTYSAQYYLGILVAAVGVVAGVIAASWLTIHPSWVTADVAATATIVAGACAGLAALLPPVTRTPATRDAELVAAMAGALPDDVAKRHGLTVIPEGDHIEVSSPEKPLDTL
jgi:hypothetical protein